MSKTRLLLFAMALALSLTAIQLHSAPPAAAASSTVEVSSVLNFATKQLDKPFRLGATGLHRYDCSGLVFRTFKEEGLTKLIGGDRRARGYYAWLENHGRVTHHPQRGDLVVWAHRHHGQPHRHLLRLQPLG